MAKLNTVSGDLGAQREAQGSKFFHRKIKAAGSPPASALKGAPSKRERGQGVKSGTK